MDVKGLKKALPVCFESEVTMLIVGPHGVGKSQGVRQAIEGQNLGKVWDFRLGQMADTGDIIGLLDVDSKADFCTFKIPERIHQVVSYCEENPDKYGVLFFDEMNRTTKDILQAIFQIVLDHELNGLKFPKNMKAVCAINPATDDYSVLDFDDKAFADRFCHVKFEPTVGDWLEYARGANVNPTITGFIGEHNEALKADHQDFELPVTPSPRSWMAIDRIMSNTNDPAVFQELLIGIVGGEIAAMFMDYKNNFNEAIKGIEILNNYTKFKKQVEQHSSVENNRDDILRNVCDDIKAELQKIEQMPKKWEKNLVAFFTTIPRDLAMGVINDFFEVPSMLNTESDPEEGLSGGKFAESKKLIDHFKGWQKENTEGENE
jgi:hypothetical protein